MNGGIKRRYYSANILTLIIATMLLVSCNNGADAFFSGRPSEMSMVHNKIIAGPPETMIELLRIPSRFPDATETHIASWQGSVIAWWMHPQKHELMIDSLGKISRNEMYTLEVWVRVRDKYQTKKNSLLLNEIEEAINVISLPQ